MRIAIIGGGSLGLLFAAKLAPYCERLVLLARTRGQAEAIATEGIAIQEMDGVIGKIGPTNIAALCADDASDEVAQQLGEAEYVLLMLKQPAVTESLLARLKAEISPRACVICFQNGIGHESKVMAAIGAERSLFAVTTEGARREGAAAVRHTGRGTTYIGGLENTVNESLQERHFLLKDVFLQAGFLTELSKNMEERMWGKLAINCVINPLTAILNVKNGQLLNTAWSRSLMADLFTETVAVAKAHQISLPSGLWETIVQVCAATSENHSSMLQDVLAGRPTEIDYLNGRLAVMAEEAGLELPHHKMVYRLVKAIEG